MICFFRFFVEQGFAKDGGIQFIAYGDQILAMHVWEPEGFHLELKIRIVLLDHVYGLISLAELPDQFLRERIGETELKESSVFSECLSGVLIRDAGSDHAYR